MNNTLTETYTEDSLNKAMARAVNDGNFEEVDRLMAVEIDSSVPEVKEEEVELEQPVEEVKEEVPPPTEGDTPPADETAGEKDEAADEAALKPETKEEDKSRTIEAELHSLRSEAGRVPFLRRRTQELENELRLLKLSRQAPAPSQDDGKNTAKIPENLQKRIEDLRSIDPILADTLQEMAQTLRGEAEARLTDTTRTIIEQEQEAQEREFLQSQYTQLVSEVPYAPQIFASPEWKQWKETLSPGRRALAESAYADEAKVAIGAFIHEMQARRGTAPVQETPVVAETPPAAPPSKVQEERNRKLASAASTSNPVAKKSPGPIDEDALFLQMYADIQKKNHLV